MLAQRRRHLTLNWIGSMYCVWCPHQINITKWGVSLWYISNSSAISSFKLRYMGDIHLSNWIIQLLMSIKLPSSSMYTDSLMCLNINTSAITNNWPIDGLKGLAHLVLVKFKPYQVGVHQKSFIFTFIVEILKSNDICRIKKKSPTVDAPDKFILFDNHNKN